MIHFYLNVIRSIIILLFIQQIINCKSPILNAQEYTQIEWIKNYTGIDSSVVPYAITLDCENNVYITGCIENDQNNKDYITIKYTNDGLESWTKFYNNPYNLADCAKFIATDQLGNIYVTGQSYDSTYNVDITTIKYNHEGTEQWVSKYKGSINNSVTSMILDSFSNIYLLISDWGSNKFDLAAIKYNSQGCEQWTVRYNHATESWDTPSSIVVDNVGAVYITGRTSKNGANGDFLTVKYDSSGSLKWIDCYDDSQLNDISKCACIDKSGNIYIAGNNYKNYTIIKYDPDGSRDWIRKYDGIKIVDMKIDDLNKIYITGYISANNGYDFVTIKHNLDGTQQWVAIYDSTSEIPISIELDDKGNLYVAGTSYSSSSYVIVKYDSTGREIMNCYYNSEDDNENQLVDFAIDNSENIYLTGIIGELDWWGEDWIWSTISTIKYSQVATSLIKEDEGIMSNDYILFANYPNPFNATTLIQYRLPEPSYVTLVIYNMLGQKIRKLVDNKLQFDFYQIEWDGKDDYGAPVSSGLYLYRIGSCQYDKSYKMLLLR